MLTLKSQHQQWLHWQVAVSTSFSNVTRVKALSFVSWLTRLKKKVALLLVGSTCILMSHCSISGLFVKAVQKQKILPKLLNVIFSIMASSPEAEEGEDETGEDAETSLPSSFASQVCHSITICILFYVS